MWPYSASANYDTQLTVYDQLHSMHVAKQDFAEAKKLTLAFALTLQEVSAAADGTGAATKDSLTTTDSAATAITSYTAKALPGVTDWLTRLQVHTAITVTFCCCYSHDNLQLSATFTLNADQLLSECACIALFACNDYCLMIGISHNRLLVFPVQQYHVCQQC
jgi:hypothetical protein